MPAQTLASVQQYLETSYEDGDREYVDGRILERNIGEKSHSRVQRQLVGYFASRQSTLHTFCFPAQRVQVKPTRFRVPDVCVYIGREPDEEIFTAPPFLAIEILSPRDTVAYQQEKIEDYLTFGVPFVWIIDPHSRQAWVHTSEGSRPAKDGVLRTENPSIEVPLEELFGGE